MNEAETLRDKLGRMFAAWGVPIPNDMEKALYMLESSAALGKAVRAMPHKQYLAHYDKDDGTVTFLLREVDVENSIRECATPDEAMGLPK